MEEVVKMELEIPQEIEADIYLVARLLQVSQNKFLADILSREVALTQERLLLEPVYPWVSFKVDERNPLSRCAMRSRDGPLTW